MAAGTYTVEATTYGSGETGSFTLTIAGLGTTTTPGPEPTDECGQTLSGDGTVSGQWSEGCESEVAERGYARYYSFTLESESEVTITLESQDADTYLYLRAGEARSGGLPLPERRPPGSTEVSQMQETLAAGTYTVEATTYGSGETGSFTLTIAGLGTTTTPGPEPTDECGQTLSGDGTVNDQWAEGCESEVAERGYARYYTFTLNSLSEVTVTLESQDADTYLYLRAGEARSGDFLYQNDDHQASTEVSRIQETLAAGTYTVEATTYGSGETGSFTLTIAGLGSSTTPGPEPSDPCGQILTGDGSVSGVWAAGCDSEARDGSHARYYSFTLDSPSEVTVTLESQDADTYLYLRAGEARSGGLPLPERRPPGSTEVSQMQETLAAGTYTVEATTYGSGETGSFTLTIAALGTTTTESSPESDRDALVAIYHATDGPNWSWSDNWLSDAPLDQWAGVTTDSGGRVRELRLSSNRLTGEIPPELGRLTNLEYLACSRNQLSGEIPVEMGRLDNLNTLFLNSNQLSGEIPPELLSLAGLKRMGLWGNELHGEIATQASERSALSSLYNATGGHLDGQHQLAERCASIHMVRYRHRYQRWHHRSVPLPEPIEWGDTCGVGQPHQPDTPASPSQSVEWRDTCGVGPPSQPGNPVPQREPVVRTDTGGAGRPSQSG